MTFEWFECRWRSSSLCCWAEKYEEKLRFFLASDGFRDTFYRWPCFIWEKVWKFLTVIYLCCLTAHLPARSFMMWTRISVFKSSTDPRSEHFLVSFCFLDKVYLKGSRCLFLILLLSSGISGYSFKFSSLITLTFTEHNHTPRRVNLSELLSCGYVSASQRNYIFNCTYTHKYTATHIFCSIDCNWWQSPVSQTHLQTCCQREKGTTGVKQKNQPLKLVSGAPLCCRLRSDQEPAATAQYVR